MAVFEEGDKAIVEIHRSSIRPDGTLDYWVKIPNGGSDLIAGEALSPVQFQTTPEQDAVLKKVRPDLAYLPSDLVKAIRRYRATIDDPIDALIQIARDPAADRADVIRAAERVTIERAKL